MKLPQSISPCPIQEAVIEIRFEASLPSDAIFGIVYNSVKESLGELDFERLPILQIPEAIREQDANLKHQPYYRFKKENFIFQFGPLSASIVVSQPYSGWEIYLKEAIWFLKLLYNLKFIKKVLRIGIRYIDIFENQNIFKNINIAVLQNKGELLSESMRIRTTFSNGFYRSTLQIANDIIVEKESDSINASLIDIDTSKEIELDDFLLDPNKTLNDAHCLQKEIFFGLLKEEFLLSLNPVYEEK